MDKYTQDAAFWNEQHRSLAKIPVIWFMDGEQLRRSYKILSDQANETFGHENYYSPIRPALMLAGYALENILKGILVRDDPDEPFDNRGRFKHKSHDLVELAEGAGVSLDDEEKELLEILTHTTVSGGRYPIPLQASEMYPRVFTDGSIGPIGMKRYCNVTKRFKICDQIDAFFEKLSGLYDLPVEESPSE